MSQADLQPRQLTLNCDMGESFGAWPMGLDAEVMPHVDMANIACGFHASDPDTMARTLSLAAQHNVQVGAHPGYDDKAGFGRRSIPHAPESITHIVLYQAGALQALCAQYQTSVSYIKPHGALYHDMMNDQIVFAAIVKAVAVLPFCARLMIQARADNSAYRKLAEEQGVELLFEAFADRAYHADGSLVSRNKDGAVYQKADLICTQAEQIAREGSVTTVEGDKLSLDADTLCVHGDNPESVAVIQQLRGVLA